MSSDVASAVSVTASDVLAAQARLRRYLNPTPLHYAERSGCWLKLENLQRTGSYKVRGAMNALLAARERGDLRPTITASAGNHAQGLAWAAYRLGMQAITVMPKTAPETKIAGVAHWGATVRLHGETYDEAKAFATKIAEEGRKEWETSSKDLAERIRELLAKADFAHKSEVAQLERRIQLLEEKVEATFKLPTN